MGGRERERKKKMNLMNRNDGTGVEIQNEMILRDFFVGFNVSCCKKCDLWESEILMIMVNTNRYCIWLARMIEEPAHISIEIRIDAILKMTHRQRKRNNSLIWRWAEGNTRKKKSDIYARRSQIKEISIICSAISFTFC